MMTWSSVLYTTARWSAAPPVATRFSSSPTPSNITFLDRIMMMVIRWWWSGSSGFPPPPHRPASPSWSGWWWSGDGDGGGHHLPGHYQQYRGPNEKPISTFETRIPFFQSHASRREWEFVLSISDFKTRTRIEIQTILVITVMLLDIAAMMMSRCCIQITFDALQYM